MCSTAKVDLVQSIGADHVLDYTRESFAGGAQRYDLIVGIGGNSSLSMLRGALTERGSLVIVGGEEGGRWTGGFGRQLRAVALSVFVRQRMTMFMCKETHVDLERLTEHIGAGDVVATIDRTYPLSEAPAALRHLEAGHVRGKVAIIV